MLGFVGSQKILRGKYIFGIGFGNLYSSFSIRSEVKDYFDCI